MIEGGEIPVIVGNGTCSPGNCYVLTVYRAARVGVSRDCGAVKGGATWPG